MLHLQGAVPLVDRPANSACKQLLHLLTWPES